MLALHISSKICSLILESSTMCRHTLHNRENWGVGANSYKEKIPPFLTFCGTSVLVHFHDSTRFTIILAVVVFLSFLPPLSSFKPVYSSECVFLSRRLPRRLDATSSHGVPGSMVATAATAAASEAGDDDVKNADNAVDDSGQHGTNAVDDGHQAVSDGAEDGFEARDDGTHSDGIVRRWPLEAEFGGSLRCCRSE